MTWHWKRYGKKFLDPPTERSVKGIQRHPRTNERSLDNRMPTNERFLRYLRKKENFLGFRKANSFRYPKAKEKSPNSLNSKVLYTKLSFLYTFDQKFKQPGLIVTEEREEITIQDDYGIRKNNFIRLEDYSTGFIHMFETSCF